MEEKFTQKSMEALSEAHNFAVRYKSSDMKVEHLLLALIGQMNGLIHLASQGAARLVHRCEQLSRHL